MKQRTYPVVSLLATTVLGLFAIASSSMAQIPKMAPKASGSSDRTYTVNEVPPTAFTTSLTANATAGAHAEALQFYPELGKAGSDFNRKFLALVKRSQGENPKIFSSNRWPVILANEVAAAELPTSVSYSLQRPRQLLPSSPEWQFLKVYREGDDIVVPHAFATVFGWDTELQVQDPHDNGKCASKLHTSENPGLLGCALPVSLLRRSTAGSPFAKLPIPWFSSVVVTHKGKSITVQLVDNGPSAPDARDRSRAGIDLTPAACLALGISLEDLRNDRALFNVSFRLPGAAKQAAVF